MIKEHLLSLGLEQYQLFLEHFALAKIDCDAYHIHQMRVSAKRLNGLSGYLKFQNVNDLMSVENTLLLDIQPVYKASGKVRNLQVVHDLLYDFSNRDVPEQLETYIKEKLSRRNQKFISVASEGTFLEPNQFREKMSRMLVPFHEDNSQSFNEYIEWGRDQALNLIRSHPPGKEWHEARTSFKRNYLLMQMAETIGAVAVYEKEMMHFRELEQLLGQWHDLFILVKMGRKIIEKEDYNLDNIWEGFFKIIAGTMHSLEQDIRYLIS